MSLEKKKIFLNSFPLEKWLKNAHHKKSCIEKTQESFSVSFSNFNAAQDSGKKV